MINITLEIKPLFKKFIDDQNENEFRLLIQNREDRRDVYDALGRYRRSAYIRPTELRISQSGHAIYCLKPSHPLFNEKKLPNISLFDGKQNKTMSGKTVDILHRHGIRDIEALKSIDDRILLNMRNLGDDGRFEIRKFLQGGTYDE